MSPLACVIDVDGVLFDYVHHLGDVAAAHFGRPRSDFPPAEVWNFYKEQWGLSTTEFLELVDIGVAEHDFLFAGDPYEDALAGFEVLASLGAHIHIATHIGEEGDPKGHQRARRGWLDRHGFAYADLSFTGDKASVARPYLEEGWTVFGLEDNVDNFRSLQAAGVQAYLLDQAWNRSESQAPRVSSVLDFAGCVAESL